MGGGSPGGESSNMEGVESRAHLHGTFNANSEHKVTQVGYRNLFQKYQSINKSN